MRQMVYNKLKETAGRKQLITYKELAAAAGLDWNKDYGQCRQIFPILKAICTAEVREGRSMLSVVVVRQDTRMPGSGFFALARKLGRYDGGTDHYFWTAERDAVWDLWGTKYRESERGFAPLTKTLPPLL
jgi:hypothetical protein